MQVNVQQLCSPNSSCLTNVNAEGATHAEIIADSEMVELIASLKYLRANYVHFESPEQCMYEALSPILKRCRNTMNVN